jgi:dienelactone hydrolase
MKKLLSTRRSGPQLVATWFCAVFLVSITLAASAQLPDNVGTRSVEIWSDGTRLAGDLFYPKNIETGQKLPAIVLCHGWGGTKEHLNNPVYGYAPQFAAEGYFVLTFDYRGWGESDSRLVVRDKMPEPDENGEVTVRAQVIRDVVSPVERVEDISACISWLELEPGVDRNRIGLWGTSFGGGNVVSMAAHDERVKCVCTQVGDVNTRYGWMFAVKAIIARYPKASGTSAELENQLNGVLQRSAKRAGEIERLMRAGKITEDSIKNPLNPKGMLVILKDGSDDKHIAALVEEENKDRKIFYSILANDPDRADLIILKQRAERARGLIDPFPQGSVSGTIPGLNGVAIATEHILYSAVEQAGKITCPVQIIETSAEEMMDIEQVGGRLYRELKGRVQVDRHVFEGQKHYDIYRRGRARAVKLQIEWFNKHLKGEIKEARTDKEQVQDTLDRMFGTEDTDQFMEFVSEDFTHHHYFDKDGYREFLREAREAGVEFTSTYDPDDITIEGDMATVPTMAASSMGTFPVPLKLRREDGVWRIVSTD